MTDAPAMRAATIREVLKLIDELGEPQRSQIRARFDPEKQKRLEATLSVGWVELTDYTQITVAVSQVLEPRDAHAFWVKTSLRSMGHPLLKSVVEIVIKLSGMTPLALVKSLERTWGNVCRGCGTMKVLDFTESDAHVRLLLPSVMLKESYLPYWLETTRSGLHSFFDLTRATGTVAMTPMTPDGEVVFHFQWKSVA